MGYLVSSSRCFYKPYYLFMEMPIEHTPALNCAGSQELIAAEDKPRIRYPADKIMGIRPTT